MEATCNKSGISPTTWTKTKKLPPLRSDPELVLLPWYQGGTENFFYLLSCALLIDSSWFTEETC